MTETERLLAWYDRERRPLPWRQNAGPWAILVSEMMLQQTRVEVVLRYFTRFLDRFPSPDALAAADEGELLAHWSGLGYYRRARALRAAAAEIVRRGGMPRGAAELEQLPGVGPYTAAAVASIAFGEPVGVVDGNVVRVVARRLALAGRTELAEVRARIRAAAARLLDPTRPGDSNQALMELGATLCTPRRPRCGDCPLAAGCRAREEGAVERYPERRTRPKPVAIAIAAAAVARDATLLLVRRGGSEELLPGLWELPSVEAAESEPDPDPIPETTVRLAESFAARYGGAWNLGARRAQVRHTITFRSLTITAYSAVWSPSAVPPVVLGEVAENEGAGWFTLAEAFALPLTGAARKLVRRLLEPAAAG